MDAASRGSSGEEHPVAAGPEAWAHLLDLGPGEDQQVDGQVARPVDQVVQEVQQPDVSVVRVLHQQHDRVHCRHPLEERPPAGEQLLPRQLTSRVVGERHAQQPAEPGPHVGLLGRVRDPGPDAVGQLDRRGLRRVLLGDAETLADHLGQRPEGHAFSVGQAAAPVPSRRADQAVDVLLELPAQPRLAHAGRPGDHDEPGDAALTRCLEEVPHRADLDVPPGHRRLETVDPLGPTDSGEHPGRPPQLLRCDLALEGVLAGVVEADRARAQPPGAPVDEHLSGIGGCLHARCGVHRIAGHHALVRRPDGHRDVARDDARAGREPVHTGLGP